MGIPRGSARLLIEEAKRRPFEGTVLQLGRSTVYFTARDLERWAKRHGFALAAGIPETLSHDPRLAAQGCLSDQTFFRRLGFERVSSCDISEWEGADHIVDLNRPLPPELEGKFDVVFETGTILQIFHLPQVLSNLHRLLRVGGRVIHCGDAANNHVDLGFYQLCPTLFADFYAANHYQVDRHLLCEYFSYWHRGRLYTDRWQVYDYLPGCLDALSFGRYGGHQAVTFLVATKTAESTGDVLPQLGQYRRMWLEHAQGAAGAAAAAGAPAAGDDGLLGRWRATRGLELAAKRVIETVRRRFLRRRMPPLRMRV